MKTVNATVFVEGTSDKRLIDCLIRQVNLVGIRTHEIQGGISKLRNIQPVIMRERDEGRRIALVLDADGDFERRRSEVRDQVKKLELPVDDDDFFLLPNHRDPGSLEVLLQKMAVDGHEALHRCFEEYGDCLGNLQGNYVRPDLKAKIYAYCEALGAEPRPARRQYGDGRFWNFDDPVLDELKKFLQGFAADPNGAAL